MVKYRGTGARRRCTRHCSWMVAITFIPAGTVNAQPPPAVKALEPLPFPQPKHDLSTPEAAVRSFCAAMTLHDVDRALACVYKANTRNRAKLVENLGLGAKMKETYTVLNIDIQKTEMPHCVLATLECQFERVEKPGAPMVSFRMKEPLQLLRDDDKWKVLSGDPANQWTPAQGGFLQMTATAIAHPEVWEPESRCASRMADLAADVDYSVVRKYGGKLSVKQKAEDAKADITKTKDWSLLKQAIAADFTVGMGPTPERVFHCPADGDDLNRESYSFNEKLDGLIASTIAEPQNTVMLYEGKDGKTVFRHEGRAAVAFVDGHVEMINAELARTLNWVAVVKP